MSKVPTEKPPHVPTGREMVYCCVNWRCKNKGRNFRGPHNADVVAATGARTKCANCGVEAEFVALVMLEERRRGK